MSLGKHLSLPVIAAAVMVLAGLTLLSGCVVTGEKSPASPLKGSAWTVPGLDMEMVYVAPGSFTRGAENDEKDDVLARPRRRKMKRTGAPHQVTLTKGYWIGVGEVTQNQWRRVMNSEPAHFKGGSLPVERVSWNDCDEFCRRLNKTERAAGRLPAGMVYRLPTEAEWEFAARGGGKGGGKTQSYSGADRLDDAGWFQGNADRSTHPGGGKAANALGLRDMSGNVAEWCLDWKAPYDGDAVNPAGPSKGYYRVFRGGSWYHHEPDCRIECRDCYGPDGRDNYIGFRLALGPEL